MICAPLLACLTMRLAYNPSWSLINTLTLGTEYALLNYRAPEP